MPLIQNRKSKVESFVTVEDWAEMQRKGFAGRFSIVDDTDMQETVIKKPEIFEIPEEAVSDYVAYNDITKDTLRAELDRKGIDYPVGATKKDLYQLYIDG